MSKYFRQYQLFSSHVLKTKSLWSFDEHNFSSLKNKENADEMNYS